MSLELRITTALLLVFASLFAVIVTIDSDLPGRVQDLPSTERDVVNQLRSFGYIISDTGFS